MTTWDEIKDQLERYGGEPHVSLLPVLAALTDLNDDIQHMRSQDCVIDSRNKVTLALNRVSFK